MAADPQRSGPPAPGQTEPGPFGTPVGDDTTDARFLDAWGGLLHAIGHGLQGGLHRSAEARRRMKAKR